MNRHERRALLAISIRRPRAEHREEGPQSKGAHFSRVRAVVRVLEVDPATAAWILKNLEPKKRKARLRSFSGQVSDPLKKKKRHKKRAPRKPRTSSK